MIRRTAPLNGLPKSWLQIGQASQCPMKGAIMAANRRAGRPRSYVETRVESLRLQLDRFNRTLRMQEYQLQAGPWLGEAQSLGGSRSKGLNCDDWERY